MNNLCYDYWRSRIGFDKKQIGLATVRSIRRGIVLLIGVVVLILLAGAPAAAQTNGQVVRLAKLDIYPAQLESYKAALREGITTALRVEPGVLTLYAVVEKDHPTRITILEIYASEEAYRAHVQTPHFLKYKTSTQSMIKSLELIDTVPLVPGVKVK
ncbi:putative quinol monooxygenase [Hymenobacter sp. BT491]|uniref:putative quinol monooxygenase n=1 Tax=Hymenobacter sp. BT491 TaxID=2766779 RepID=UPI001653A3C0|nr:putative quinol monooxygenase [Hymenobacter sp. BT491]MBC6991290.1 antibiotic biosynthesis monooxygenase [Hymenobacter sp. BT491]